MTTWVKDENGNKCSVEYFGSNDAAQKALDSLIGCENCTNCSRCYDCYDCSGCSRCSGCYDCYDCYGCYDCYDCSGCYDCYDCSGCSRCSRCSGCSGCYGCYGCYDCYDCYDCSRCSGQKGQKSETVKVPIIKNIHQTVFKAASQKESLDMNSWHSCDNTHYRAGWVVTLAGDEGKELENRFDTCLAAMKIYDASSELDKINPVRFFQTNEDALADMERMAKKEDSL